MSIYQAEVILWAQGVKGRQGVFETAEGSEWENVLVTTPEDEAPPMDSSKVHLAFLKTFSMQKVVTGL